MICVNKCVIMYILVHIFKFTYLYTCNYLNFNVSIYIVVYITSSENSDMYVDPILFILFVLGARILRFVIWHYYSTFTTTFYCKSRAS